MHVVRATDLTSWTRRCRAVGIATALGAGTLLFGAIDFVYSLVLGSLVYLLTRPTSAYVVAVAPERAGSVTAELSELDRLRQAGAIDDQEFQVAKADVLAGVPMPRAGESGASTPAAAGGATRS